MSWFRVKGGRIKMKYFTIKMSSDTIILLRFQWQIKKISLEICLDPGFVSALPLDNNTDKRNLECDYKCKTTKILVKTKIREKKSRNALRYCSVCV